MARDESQRLRKRPHPPHRQRRQEQARRNSNDTGPMARRANRGSSGSTDVFGLDPEPLGRPRVPDAVHNRGRLRPAAGVATARRAHRVRPRPGDVAARPPAQVGRPRRRLRPAHGVAPALQHSRPPRLAPHRRRPRCPCRIETESLPNRNLQTSQHGDKTPLRGECLCADHVSADPPVEPTRSTVEMASGGVGSARQPRSANRMGRLGPIMNDPR